MSATAVSSELLPWWGAALALGLVVAIALVVLLQSLLNRVREIEQEAGKVWSAGKDVARNTATVWMLNETAVVVEAIAEEAGRHARLLTERER